MKLPVCMVILAALVLSSPIFADIPAKCQYHYIYHKVEDVLMWEEAKELAIPYSGIDPPTWNPPDDNELRIGNIRVEAYVKEFYLEIDWENGQKPVEAPAVALTSEFDTNIYDRSYVEGTNSYTWTWWITPQPAWETLTFDTDDFAKLQNGVKSVEVGSFCSIPEPATAALFATVSLGVLGWARKRKK